MNIDPVLAMSLATVAFAACAAWWVLRPFERRRRELKRAARHAAAE